MVLRIVKVERKGIMARKPLSNEEIAELLRNPFVDRITPSGSIHYTPEFKRMAYESMTNGIPMRRFFEEHGFSAAVLGETRIYSFTRNLRTRTRDEDDFTDHRSSNGRGKGRSRSLQEMTLEEQVEQLRHELAYARQELEFLKKIQEAELEAEKARKARHRRRPGSH